MKTKIFILLVGLLMVGVHSYAGNGDLNVSGTLGVGMTPDADGNKLQVSPKMKIKGVGSLTPSFFLQSSVQNAKGLTTHAIFGPYADPLNGEAGTLYIGSGASADGTRNNIQLYNYGCPGGLCNVPWIYLSADHTSVSGQIFTSSDVRLKDDVQDLSGVLQKLKAVRGVSYRWANKNRPQERRVGVIAQEVEKVFPELVTNVSNLAPGAGSDLKQSKAVDYQALAVLALEGVRELSDKVDELEERLVAIENKLEKPN